MGVGVAGLASAFAMAMIAAAPTSESTDAIAGSSPGAIVPGDNLDFAPPPEPPRARGYGFFGAALGVQVVSGLSTLVGYQQIVQRCLAGPDPRDVDEGRRCMRRHADTLALITVGGLLGRGSVAFAGVGGDIAGTHDGANDAWRYRPKRDPRAHLLLGGVMLGAGIASLAASASFQWIQRRNCTARVEWIDYRECMIGTMYTEWGLGVLSNLGLSIGAGLLAYGNAYRDEYEIWSVKRRHAFKVGPRIGHGQLGLDASMRF